MLAAFLTTLFFSISAVSGSRATRVMSGTEANVWRLSIATLVLALYTYFLSAGLSRVGFVTLFLSGCIGFGVGDLALFQAYPRIGSRLTMVVVQCLAAPFAALTEWLWLGTTLTGQQMACGILILAGVALALAPGKHMQITRRQLYVGASFGLLAAYGQAFGAVLSRKAYTVMKLAGEPIDGISVAFQRITGGLIFSGCFLLFLKRREIAHHLTQRQPHPSAHPDRWRKGWYWLILNGLAGPAFGVSCYQWALKTTPTGVVLPIVAITPIVVVPFTLWLEGEKPTVRSLLGGFLAVTGAALLTLAAK